MELNKIYNEDCMVGMKKIPDASVDLIATDVPYRITSRGNAGSVTPFVGVWIETGNSIPCASSRGRHTLRGCVD